MKYLRAGKGWKLGLCFLFSVILHCLIFVLSSFGGGFPKVDAKRPVFISAIVSANSPSPEKVATGNSSGGRRIERLIGLEGGVASDPETFKVQPNSPPLVMTLDELDEAVDVVVEPQLEPLYGFSDDASGRVILNLLINDLGAVVWVGVSTADLDPISTQFIIKAFGAAKFGRPTVAGRPVYTMLQVEVRVGAQ